MKYGQRNRPNVYLSEESTPLEEPLQNLSKIPTQKVLTHVLKRTNEEFHGLYGNILGRIGMLSVQRTLQDAFTPETRSLFSILESDSIGLNEYVERFDIVDELELIYFLGYGNLGGTQKRTTVWESIFTSCGLVKGSSGSTLANR
jgi:hypothetical protein